MTYLSSRDQRTALSRVQLNSYLKNINLSFNVMYNWHYNICGRIKGTYLDFYVIHTACWRRNE